MLKPNANNYFKIPVVNDPNKDVTLHKNTELGYIWSIKSTVSPQVEEREQTVVNTIISSRVDKPVDKKTSEHKETMNQAKAKGNLKLTEKQHRSSTI